MTPNRIRSCGGDLHVGRGVLRLGGVAPQDRGRAFRRDHAVDRVLQHQHAVGGGDRDGAARAAFADDDRDVGHAELEAGFGRARDGLGLAALLGADAGIGAGGVDQRDHRHVEAVGHLHQPHRLAVALRPRHAEIVLEPALGVGALLVADDADALAAEAAEAADDRVVLAELAVAGERREIGDQRARRSRGNAAAADGARPASSARASAWHRGRRAPARPWPRAARSPRRSRPRRRSACMRAQFLDLGLELGDRLFEIEIGAHRASI